MRILNSGSEGKEEAFLNISGDLGPGDIQVVGSTDPSFRFQATGSRGSGPGCRCSGPVSRFLVSGSMDSGSWFQAQDSRDAGQGSRFQDPGSRHSVSRFPMNIQCDCTASLYQTAIVMS